MINRNPTSWDIAAAAGVSQATVSRALRNSDLVHPETRERIQRIAREMNYSVNRNAAGLRSHQSNTLALLLFDETGDLTFEANPLFLSMLGSITRSAGVLGYDVLVSFQNMADDWHQAYKVANRADGLILLGYGDFMHYHEKLAALVAADARFILWGPAPTDPAVTTIGSDNVEGGRLATQHLLDQGHRRIAFFGHASASNPELAGRYQGYLQALANAGLAVDKALHIQVNADEAEAAQALNKLAEKGALPDAIFAATDSIAIGLLQACKANNIRVPQDIALIGFDDLPVTGYLGLSSVRQNVQLAGQLLVNNLVQQIEGKPVDSVLMTPELVVRESSQLAVTPHST